MAERKAQRELVVGRDCSEHRRQLPKLHRKPPGRGEQERTLSMSCLALSLLHVALHTLHYQVLGNLDR